MKLGKKIAIIVSIVAGVFVVYMAVQIVMITQNMNEPSILDLAKYCNYEINATTIDRPANDILENCRPNPNSTSIR